MDFSYSEEQNMLKTSVGRYLRDAYPFEGYRKIIESDAGYSADTWAAFAEQGWLAMPFAEADGGFDGGPIELLLMTEQFGRGLSVEPYISNIVLSGQLIARLGSDAQRAALIPGLIEGSSQISFAHAEVAGRHKRAYCATTAKRDGDGYVLNGIKSVVLNAQNADKIIVLARSSGEVASESGLSLFVVDTAAVELKSYAVLGGGVAAEITLNNVQVDADALLGTEGEAFETVDDVLDLATAATCADAYGAMQALLEKTLEYLKTRKQFGVPLGTFQVLQHRLVDMFIEVQQSQSMILMVSLKLMDADRAERQKAVSACKAYLHKASKFVAQQAVQLHGGIGMTEELDIGHYFRRLTAFGNMYGDREHHLQRFAALTQNVEARREPKLAAAA